jgi:hypothetical protein
MSNDDTDGSFVKKKVFILTVEGRKYSGIVIQDLGHSILLRDIYSHLVMLKKEEIRILQEER